MNEYDLICDVCQNACVTEQDLKVHMETVHKSAALPEETKFKCGACAFESLSSKGLKVHKKAKHKIALKPPISCVRQDYGCRNLVENYYDKYTAICSDCSKLLETHLKSSSFGQNLCPCCREESGGNAYSLCKECLEDVDSLGFVNSGWGAWHLNKDSGEIICIHLDVN